MIKHRLLEEFDASRNISAQIASGEWMLYLDADERLTPSIAETIAALLDENDPSVAGYALPFKVNASKCARSPWRWRGPTVSDR